MIICVIATASALRGALAIYKQFISHLEKDVGDDVWHVFVDVNMPMPANPNVVYHVCHTKGLGRIWFDLFGFRMICHKKGIVPNVIFSLQNTNVNMGALRKVIYYHQPLPLFRYKISLSENNVISHCAYTYLYPFYVRLLVNANTYVAVQTETIKEMFSDRYNFPLDKVGVYFPHVDKINPTNLPLFQYEDDTYNFVYPAMESAYKEHITLAYALKRVNEIAPKEANRIKVHLTICESQIKKLTDYIIHNGLDDNFVFHGGMSHNQIMSMLKSCQGLLFPSVVETLGLPLLEAASLGIPVVANDMGYVHDVLDGYDGLQLVKVHDYDGWANRILNCCRDKKRFMPFSPSESDSWDRLFVLIKEGVIK